MVNLLTLNVSASLNVFRLIANPSLCLPHHTVPTFNHLPIPLSNAFNKDGKRVDIRAVVLDKDNCFAVPKQNEVYKPYAVSDVSRLEYRVLQQDWSLQRGLSLSNLHVSFETLSIPPPRKEKKGPPKISLITMEDSNISVRLLIRTCIGTIRGAQAGLPRFTATYSIKFGRYPFRPDWRRSGPSRKIYWSQGATA